VSRVRFIRPALAKLRSSPPSGKGWQYELKFGGYRVQLHKVGTVATIDSKNGADFTRRFPTIAAAILALPTKTCIIDGELIAAGGGGEPNFVALLRGKAPVCVYAFDLLELQGWDLRELPLEQRRARLKRLLARAECNLIRYNEAFPDAGVLLQKCVRLGLEGIVCKRKDSAYRSGTRSGWIKVKTATWKTANQYPAKPLVKT